MKQSCISDFLWHRSQIVHNIYVFVYWNSQIDKTDLVGIPGGFVGSCSLAT